MILKDDLPFMYFSNVNTPPSSDVSSVNGLRILRDLWPVFNANAAEEFCWVLELWSCCFEEVMWLCVRAESQLEPRGVESTWNV